MTTAVVVTARRLWRRRRGGVPQLDSALAATAWDLAVLDGRTLNARGPLPTACEPGAPVELELARGGAEPRTVAAQVHVVDGEPCWTVTSDLGALLGAEPTRWLLSLAQGDSTWPLVGTLGPSVTSDGLLLTNPPSANGTHYAPVAEDDGQLALEVTPPRRSARVVELLHGPGVLRAEVALGRIAPGDVTAVMARNKDVGEVTLPVTTTSTGGLLLSVPVLDLLARQQPDEVVWTFRVVTAQDTTTVTRDWTDIVSLPRALRFPPLTTVGADGSRARVRPFYTSKKAFAVRVTRLPKSAVDRTARESQGEL